MKEYFSMFYSDFFSFFKLLHHLWPKFGIVIEILFDVSKPREVLKTLEDEVYIVFELGFSVSFLLVLHISIESTFCLFSLTQDNVSKTTPQLTPPSSIFFLSDLIAFIAR